MRLPNTLGACADAIYDLRARRLELEHQADELKADEAKFTEHIFELLAKSKLEKSGSKSVTLAITHTRIPVIQDYDAFTKYVLKTKAVELLERRASRGACMERWDAGEAIPGIEVMDRKGLSITKVG